MHHSLAQSLARKPEKQSFSTTSNVMEAALLCSRKTIDVTPTLQVRACVFFGKYISLKRHEGSSMSFSKRQFTILMGEFAESMKQHERLGGSGSNSHAFSNTKRVTQRNGQELVFRDKEKELRLTQEEWKALVTVKDEVLGLLDKFIVLTPTLPEQTAQLVSAQQQQQSQNGHDTEDDGEVSDYVYMGPQYTFVLERLVEAQRTRTPSYRKLLANRMCDEEIHVLMLAAMVKEELTEEARAAKCNGCLTDHPSQKQHMDPGHMDDPTAEVEEWLANPLHRNFLRDAISIAATRLDAPIADLSKEVPLDKVVSAAEGNYSQFCMPCRLMVPLYNELIAAMGVGKKE